MSSVTASQRTLWDFHVTVLGRWWRTAAFYEDAPGSHMDFWRTDYAGLRGWNCRVGSLARFLILLVHTRPERPSESPAARG
ncbi:hypothetical protein [Streptomyces sp. NPDC047009]|uniref:hypothetical protein n=1 Tax=Streptomyces sp. NPDC047009 TaxID=3154496 RepID=UPI0033FEB0D6